VLHDLRAEPDLGRRVYSYFTKIGFNILSDHYEATGQRMMLDDLADVLFDKIVNSAYVKYIAEDGTPGAGVVTYGDAHRKAREAADFLLAEWRADYRQQARERGARGGRNSVRPKDYTVEMLLEVRAAHPGVNLSKSQEAAIMGISTATVGRLRRELEQQR
jgi:hypothetical protein